MAARKPVDIIDDALGCHRCGPSYAFFRRLKENLHGSFELIAVFGNPARKRQADSRVAVVAAGVRKTLVFGAVVPLVGFVFGSFGLFNGQRIDVKAQRRNRPRTSRLTNGHCARVAFK